MGAMFWGKAGVLAVVLAALLLTAGSGCIIIWKDEGSVQGRPVLETTVTAEDSQTKAS